jgi:CubicO group peptidase (beta-lactamase class C family)
MAQDTGHASGKNVPNAPSQPQGPTDPAEMETFLDELFAKQMAENHIAGAAVSVVKDGKLFFTKGYGYADVAEGVPVDPEQTIFAIGSVGKVFTWTAVMQLVEQGKLDLDADINTYLDFRIPDTYPQPITLKHLMTHTSGLEERWFGSGVTDPSDVVPAREFLISNLPKRLHPPGDFAGYSNYNAILAGYIVAQVSGQPYDQYIQQNILDPLGMAHSTVQWPLPPSLSAIVSEGYMVKDDAFQVLPGYVPQPAGLPSGFHHASVTDMGRFMIAHLQGGRYNDAAIPDGRILKEATARQMQSTLYTADPRLLGAAYGFFDMSDNGQRTFGHQGYLPPMHGLLMLLPDQNLGIYVVYNTESAGGLTTQHVGFQRAFFDHYYPAPAIDPIQPPADFAERAGRFIGTYRYASSPSSTLPKIIGLFGAYMAKISDPGDGTLLANIHGLESRYVEVEENYFRQVDGPISLVFRADERGRIRYLYTDLMPQFASIKLDWYDTPAFSMAILLGCILVFLITIPVVAIRMVRNRRLRIDRKPASGGANLAYWIILGISLLNLLNQTGTQLGGAKVMENVLLDPPLLIKIVLGIGVTSAVLTVGALVYAVLAWKKGYWGIAARIYYTLVTVAAVAYIWFLNQWNLLGWRY